MGLSGQGLQVGLVTAHLGIDARLRLGQFGLALGELQAGIAIVETHQQLTPGHGIALDRGNLEHIGRQGRGQVAQGGSHIALEPENTHGRLQGPVFVEHASAPRAHRCVS